MNLIEIRQATVYRGATRVFADLTLTIPLGRHTAILGPNGAGKSTLLKLLSRDISPVHRDGSHLRLFGEDRWNVWDLRTRLGILSHDLQLSYLGSARGLEAVLSGYYASVGIHPHHTFSSDQYARAGRIMDRLGIGALKDRAFAQMSTGEQRPVCSAARWCTIRPRWCWMSPPAVWTCALARTTCRRSAA